MAPPRVFSPPVPLAETDLSEEADRISAGERIRTSPSFRTQRSERCAATNTPHQQKKGRLRVCCYAKCSEGRFGRRDRGVLPSALALLRMRCTPSNPHFLSYCAGKTDPCYLTVWSRAPKLLEETSPVAGVRNANVPQRRLVFASLWLYSGQAVYPSAVLLTSMGTGKA